MRGSTVAAVFERAAVGMFSLMVDVDAVHADVSVRVRCDAPTLAELLVEWLARLLAERDIQGLVFSTFSVSVNQMGKRCALDATARGEPLDAVRHVAATEVKGVSLLGLRVEENEGEWIAQCVFDV